MADEHDDDGSLADALVTALAADEAAATPTDAPDAAEPAVEAEPSDASPEAPSPSQTAPGTPATPPPSEQPVTLAEKFQKRGINVSKYRNDDELIEGLVNMQKALGQREQLADLGRRLQENPAEVYQILQRHFGQQPENLEQTKQASQPAGTLPPRPEWNPEWLGQVRRDENGALVALPHAEPDVLNKITRYARWKEQAEQQLLHDPKATLLPVLLDDFRQIARQEAQQAVGGLAGTMQQNQQAAQLQQIVAAESPWLFVEGDQSKGLTPAGLAFSRHVQEAAPFIQDVGLLVEHARLKAYTEVFGQPSGPPAPTAPDKPTRRPTLSKTTTPPDFEDGRSLNDVLAEAFDKGLLV